MKIGSTEISNIKIGSTAINSVIKDGIFYFRSGVLVPGNPDILFWLDGTIVDVAGTKYFQDKSSNARNFLITNYDFSSDWTTGMPYKSAATISAPAGDTALIAADINNYLYDSGGTPNQIPVVSLFQDIDYGHRLFCRHTAQVLDGNDVETYEARVLEVVFYSTAKTGADLTLCNTYFNVPAKLSSAFREVGTGKTYSTIAAAITAASADETIYIYSGTYTENLNISKVLNIVGVGRSIITPTASQTYALQTFANVNFKGLDIRSNGSTYGMYLNCTGSTTIDFCKIWKAIDRSVWFRTTPAGLLKNSIVDGYLYYQTANFLIDNCRLGLTSAPNQTYLLRPSGTFTNAYTNYFKHSKIIITEAATSNFYIVLNYIADSNFHNNYINVVNISSVGDVYLSYNTLIAQQGYQANSGILATGFKRCVYNYVKTTVGTGTVLQCVGLSGAVVCENNRFDIFNGGITNLQLLNNAANSLSFKNNVLISRNMESSGVSANNIGINAGVTAEESTIIVENNTFLNPRAMGAAIGKGGHCCLYVGNQKNATVRYNYFAGAEVGELIVKGMVNATTGLDATNSIVAYNIIDDGRLIIKGVSNLKVYNNYISIAKQMDGLAAYSPLEILLSSGGDTHDIGNDLRNNILINLRTSLVMAIGTGCDTNVYHNNLFYSDEGFTITIGGTTYNSFAEFLALGLDIASLNQNPNIVNLLPTPKIEAGEDLGSTYESGLDITTDWGNSSAIPVIVNRTQPVTGAWQVGAYVQ